MLITFYPHASQDTFLLATPWTWLVYVYLYTLHSLHTKWRWQFLKRGLKILGKRRGKKLNGFSKRPSPMHCRDCKILQNKAQELRQFEDGEEKWNTLEKTWKDFSPLMWKTSRGSILRMGTHNFRVRNCPSVCFPRIRASHCSKWDLMDNIYGQYILLNFTLFSSLQSPLTSARAPCYTDTSLWGQGGSSPNTFHTSRPNSPKKNSYHAYFQNL